MTADRATGPGIWQAYRLRLKRRRLLWRAFRSRHQLKSMQNRTGAIAPGDILLVMVVRNEALRLPYFLDYYRRLGVAQFLVVDNDSTETNSTGQQQRDQEDARRNQEQGPEATEQGETLHCRNRRDRDDEQAGGVGDHAQQRGRHHYAHGQLSRLFPIRHLGVDLVEALGELHAV